MVPGLRGGYSSLTGLRGLSETLRDNLCGVEMLREQSCGDQRVFFEWLTNCLSRRGHVFASNGVEREFHSAGNPDFVIDIAQIVPNRMLSNANLETDLASAQALRQQVHDFAFAWCQETHTAAGLNSSQRLELGEEVEQVDEFLGVCPNLSAMHGSNALGQQLERVNAADDTSRTAPEGVDHQFTVGNRDHHDRGSFWTGHRQALQDAVAGHLSILQMSIDQGNIGLAPSQLPDCFGGIIGNANDADVLFAACQFAGKQVRAHEVGISDEDTYSPVREFWQMVHRIPTRLYLQR